MAFSRHEPVRLEIIERGAFLEAFDRAFHEAEQKLLAHIDKYEGLSAKSQALAAIALEYNQKTGSVSIRTEVDVKPPKRPSRIKGTAAFIEDGIDQPGQCLWCQAGGTSIDNAKQTVMRDEEGNPVG